MKFKLQLCVLSLNLIAAGVFAQLTLDPLPYASIANPLPDTMDQLYRDSVNLKISRVRVNQAGYRPQDQKNFYYVASGVASAFQVINESRATVASGSFSSTGLTTAGQLYIRASNNAQLITGGDTRYTMESPEISGTIFEGLIPDLAPGIYRVVVGSDTSAGFVIDERVYSWTRDALLKFYGVNRCGDTHSWFHPPCHLQDEITGGWHDCGDHLKEGSTQGYAAAMLGLVAAVFSDRDQDVYGVNQSNTIITDGIPDMLYEARHGTDYILQSYDKAGGQVANMITSMGDFGEDHTWWGRPENQDNMPQARGGPPRAARPNLGADILGDFAADLAFVSKLYRGYNAVYSDRCLQAAKDLYEYGKANPGVATSEAYHGQTTYNDDLAFAALALLWATGERKYLDELCYDPIIGAKSSAIAFPKALFEGGWFANYDPIFYHSFANTDWGSVQTPVLWGFYRLILDDAQFCTTLGLTDAQRAALIEKTAYNLIANVSSVALGTQTVELPNAGIWTSSVIKYELPWFTMQTQMEWVWNRYQSGNITEMYCYYDVASRIQGMELPYTPATTDWKAQEAKQILVRQLDYMLGVNPWDISMIYGIGDKNFNHPHHRAANPEGKNVAGAFYRYRPPVGALQGGYMPNTSLYSEHYDDFYHSETGIDGTTNILIPVTGLAKEVVLSPPSAVVKILYVGCNEAIIEVRQTRYGTTTVRYGAGDVPDQSKSGDSSGVVHRIELTGLTNGTQYNFDVLVSDLYGRDSVILNVDEDKNRVYFSFNTLQNCPTNAEITNVKVCRVTHDSAEIFWYTPNGEFDSKITYGETRPPTIVQSGDIAGHPVNFHYMKIGGLKEQTTYYFFVQSGSTIDDNGGLLYQFTTPVEHVDFDIRAVRYEWSDMTALGMNIINQDSKAYDSLDVRMYFRAKEGFENDLAARLDIGIVYDESGYQSEFSENTDIRDNISSQKPVKMEDTFDPSDGTYAYYLSVPMWGVEMKSGSRIRLDVIFDSRSPWPPYEDLMNASPQHIISDNDWSFGPHSRTNGDPVDYGGIPVGTKESVDVNYWNLEINYYMTVYRKGEFVWGYSPSFQEQQTKKTQYAMTSQITSPLVNPSEDYVFYERTVGSVDVSGYANITPIDGEINDIWVNGVAISDLSSVVTWSESQQRWNFTIPVKVQNGSNPIDITFFGGPSETCTECYGCASSNHSFYIEFQGAKQYPSMLSLRDLSMNPLSDTAKIDTTVFHIIVTDRNGNVDGKAIDTLYASVKNPVAGDSISVMLVETGDSTNVFGTVTPVSVVSLSAAQTGPGQISMTGGDKVWVTYVDPTDPTDSSSAYLVSKANFPVAVKGRIYDTNGDGAIDQMAVEYTIPLLSPPDSFIIYFPNASSGYTARGTVDSFYIDNSELVTIYFNPFPRQGITGFTSGSYGQGSSFLTHQGSVRMSQFPLLDSAGPVLNSKVTLQERLGAGDDTLTITFSEIINVTKLTGNVLILHKLSGDYPLNILGVIGTVPGTNTMTVIANSGSVQIAEGDSISISSTGALTDMPGNHAHISNPRVPVVLEAAPPQISAAFYKDTDHDGKIDLVEITFHKAVDIADLELWFTWNNSSRVIAESSSASYLDTEHKKIGVQIKGLLTDTQIVTGGTIYFYGSHANFPDINLASFVIDSAAPVIVSAVFDPSDESSVEDALTVTFSEPVSGVANGEPFDLFSIASGTQYSFELKYLKSIGETQIMFLVTSFVGIDFPTNNDSIRIDPMAGIYDNGGVVQISPDNRYGPMQVKSIKFSIEIDIGPNPFVINQSIINDNGEMPAGMAGTRGIAIRVSPVSRVTVLPDLSGKVEIYDALGNRIFKGELEIGIGGTSNMYFAWNGTNKKGRYVGTGIYMALVSVEDRDGYKKTQVCKIGVKRK